LFVAHAHRVTLLVQTVIRKTHSSPHDMVSIHHGRVRAPFFLRGLTRLSRLERLERLERGAWHVTCSLDSMSKPFCEWTVLPHGKLVQVDENILSVTGTLHMPLGDTERRMTVVRLANGSLVIYSAIALDETEMRVLDNFGTPAFLVVPNHIHRLDARAWKDRYPSTCVIAPAGSRERIEDVVPVDQSTADFGDPAVAFITVPGTGEREAALLVQSGTHLTLVINDLLFNAPTQEGFGGWIMEKLGMTGDEPHIPALVKLRQVKDKHALRHQLETWSHLPTLKRIIVSHGDIIDDDAWQVLERVAEDLAA
jgi:hypothetical protein